MGRRKIEIQPITHDRNRSVTFLKRKNGLFKKAYELGVLCSVDVCVIVFAHNGKLHEYCSGDANAILERRIKYTGDSDRRRPADFNNAKAGGASKGGGGGDSDPEDEVDSPIDDNKRTLGPSPKLGLGNSGIELPSVPHPGGYSNNSSGNLGDSRSSYLGGSNSNHPTSLPPSAHPLSIGGMATASYLSSSSSQTTQLAQAQHHHQLAQQFLVNQLQNINPNLNPNPAPPTFSFPSIPPRGTQLPFGLGGGSGSTPSASAYSNAFLSSLLGNASAAANSNSGRDDFAAPQSGRNGPFSGLEWPSISGGGQDRDGYSNRMNSNNSSSSSLPTRKDTQTPSSHSSEHPSPHPQPSTLDNAWLELLLGGATPAASGGGDDGKKHIPQVAQQRREPTPLDGVPISDGLLALSLPSNGNKRPRGGSITPNPTNARPPDRMAVDGEDSPAHHQDNNGATNEGDEENDESEGEKKRRKH